MLNQVAPALKPEIAIVVTLKALDALIEVQSYFSELIQQLVNGAAIERQTGLDRITVDVVDVESAKQTLLIVMETFLQDI